MKDSFRPNAPSYEAFVVFEADKGLYLLYLSHGVNPHIVGSKNLKR